MGALFVVFNQF